MEPEATSEPVLHIIFCPKGRGKVLHARMLGRCSCRASQRHRLEEVCQLKRSWSPGIHLVLLAVAQPAPEGADQSRKALISQPGTGVHRSVSKCLDLHRVLEVLLASAQTSKVHHMGHHQLEQAIQLHLLLVVFSDMGRLPC